jgi:glucosamine-6-phosphate deaminase
VNIRIFDTADAVAVALATSVASAVRAQPALILGLPAGRTPIPTYAELRRLHREGELDCSRIRTFNLDEFVGVDGTHPGSFRQFMQAHLFDGINVDPGKIHFLKGKAADFEAECRGYDSAIARAGGLDLTLLGLGVNGHIGFNEPGDVLVADTHRASLNDSTRRRNAPLFGGELSDVPLEALSMGMGTILKSVIIALVATGSEKAAAIERMVRGPLTTQLPASFLQLHRSVDLYLDRAAASRLSPL